MKVSIVIPSFNQGEYIEKTILSILNQNYAEKEIIIIDGGSCDSTVDVIKKYEKDIYYWVSEKDNGQSHALNKGFAKASGDIYGWQNSDDVYLEDCFEKVVKIFEEKPDVKIVYGNWYEIDENDKIVDKTYSAPKPRIPHFPYEGFDAYNQTMFWRKEVHDRFGKHDENLHMLMDGDMIFRFILNEGVDAFFKIDDFLASFRRYDGQKSPDLYLDKTTLKNEKMLENKFNFPPRNSLKGIFYRLRHRAAKLFWSLKQGGVVYTYNKFMRGYRKRKAVL